MSLNLNNRTLVIRVLRTGEEIENRSPSAPLPVYTVSDKRMHRPSADRTGRPHIDREMSYRNYGIPGLGFTYGIGRLFGTAIG